MSDTNNTCSSSDCKIPATGLAEQLNQECFCQTLDRDRLKHILSDDKLQSELLANHPQLFSNIASFISRSQYESIKTSIDAIETVISLPGYQKEVLNNSHAHAHVNKGPAGVFMGYDFHLSSSGPKLIEINTNAGGAFLNALLISAQIACCPPMQAPFLLEKEKLFREFIEMFLNEWLLQRGNTLSLKCMAIVDSEPENQFLYPEFKIAQQVFNAYGIETLIAAPEDLYLNNKQLWYKGKIIDLIYNRLTDFSLTEKNSQYLNEAYQAGAVVVTPNPFHHAIYANKRNFVTLGDQSALKKLGVSDEDIKIVTATVPATCQLTPENAENLWQQRKELFFKPVAGYGGKATYRGDKLTRRVWEEILQGQYIAQQKIVPSERSILLDNQPSSLKMDIRVYTYQGKIQLLAARLYQGQTTNFRTEGGGFSPVFVL